MPRSFVSTVAHLAQIWQRLIHPPCNLCSNRFFFRLRVRRVFKLPVLISFRLANPWRIVVLLSLRATC